MQKSGIILLFQKKCKLIKLFRALNLMQSKTLVALVLSKRKENTSSPMFSKWNPSILHQRWIKSSVHGARRQLQSWIIGAKSFPPIGGSRDHTGLFHARQIWCPKSINTTYNVRFMKRDPLWSGVRATIVSECSSVVLKCKWKTLVPRMVRTYWLNTST